jgi:hypothetical protein
MECNLGRVIFMVGRLLIGQMLVGSLGKKGCPDLPVPYSPANQSLDFVCTLVPTATMGRYGPRRVAGLGAAWKFFVTDLLDRRHDSGLPMCLDAWPSEYVRSDGSW